MSTVHTEQDLSTAASKGSGPPLVLLHATLHNCRDYDPVIPALADGHRVIAVDWPGHGDSDDATELSAAAPG